MTVHIGDRIGSLPRRDPILAAPEETLRSVAEKLWAQEVGMLIVADVHARPLGVISERDVVSALAQGADPDKTTAEKAMTNHVVSARIEDPLFDAASQMLDRAIRHLPVLDDRGTVIGMVSVRDLLRPLLIDALGGGSA